MQWSFSFCTKRHDMEVIVSTFGALLSTGDHEKQTSVQYISVWHVICASRVYVHDILYYLFKETRSVIMNIFRKKRIFLNHL